MKGVSAWLFEMRLSVECNVLIMKEITHEGKRRILADSCCRAVCSVVVLCIAAYADAMVVSSKRNGDRRQAVMSSPMPMPRRAPTSTWTGVCPISSRKRFSAIG